MELQEPLLSALDARGVRFVVIGVWGANFYAKDVSFAFSTGDQDFFLPPDAANLLQAWEACESVGLELSSGNEPLDRPRDLCLARTAAGRPKDRLFLETHKEMLAHRIRRHERPPS